MEEIKTEVVINAKPEEIWNVLTDFEKYPEWNPFIKSISGAHEEGEQLAIKVQPRVMHLKKH